MKNRSIEFFLVSVLGCLLLFASCNPDEGSVTVPVLDISEINSVTEASATILSTITSDGGSAITAKGVCWSTTPNPTIENDTTVDGSGEGEFISTITQLMQGNMYNP